MLSALDPLAILGAAALGLVISVGLGLLLGLLFVLDPRMHALLSEDLEPEEEDALLDAEVDRALNQPGMRLAIMAFALVLTVLTGFLAARWAETAPLLNAGASGVVVMVMGALMERLEDDPIPSFPRWMTVLGYVLILPATLLGGWLHVLSLSLAGAG